MANTLRKVLSTILTLSFLMTSTQSVVESSGNDGQGRNNIFDYWASDDPSSEKEFDGTYIVDSTHEYNNGSNNSLINFNYGSNNTSILKSLIHSENNFGSNYHETEWDSVVAGSDPIYTKKTISPTEIDDEFEVVMDLIGSNITTEEVPNVDIMFVIDKSSSMNSIMGTSGKTRWNVLLDSLDKFVKTNLEGDDNVRMGIVSYGTRAKSSIQVPYADVLKFPDSEGNLTKNFTSNISDILGDSENVGKHPVLQIPPVERVSNTPTYLGVDIGAKILQEAEIERPSARKVLIVLTDGYPNYYHMDKAISSITSASYHARRLNPKLESNVPSIGPHYNKANQSDRYNDDWISGDSREHMHRFFNVPTPSILREVTAHTMKTVTDSYASIPGTDIFSIGFGLTAESGNSPDVIEIEKIVNEFLKDLGPSGDYRADDQDELDRLLEEISATISKSTPSISGGTLTSEIDDKFDLIDNSVSTHSLHLEIAGDKYNLTEEILKPGAATVEDITNSKIELSNITLGGTNTTREGIRLKYKVKLKDDFRQGDFYITSQSIVGIPGHNRQIPFTNPSIRAQDIIIGSIPFEKIWTDQDNYWNTREAITLQLQIKTDDVWNPIANQTLSIQSSLTGQFDNVELSLNGVPYEYRVVELSNPKEYEDPIYSMSGNTYIIENKLKVTPLDLTKVGQSTDNILEGVEFTLYRTGESVFDEVDIDTYKAIDLISNDSGKLVDVNGQVVTIPMGNYLLRETKPLLGYESMEDLLFTVESDMSIVGVGNGLIVNNLKPFTLNIEKYDNNGNALAGVEFTLKSTDGNGYEKNQFADATDGNQFTFEGLLPGTYELTETVTPNGYVGLKKPISIEISLSGEVKLDDVIDTESGVGINGNTIQLTVINTQKGILPLTGGSGTNFIIGGGFAIVVLSMLLGLKSRKSKENFRNGKLAKVVILSALVLLVPGPNTISANNDYYTIKIHSRNHKDTGDQYENTGLQNNHDNSVGINGIGYKVYDADIFIEGLSGSNSREEIQRIVMDSKLIDLHEDENIAPYLMETIVSKNVDGTDGVATFKLAKSSSTNSLLFVQEEVVDDKHVFSSMLFILPVMDPDNPDEILDLIHLYPKENRPKVEPPVEKPEPPVEELPSTGIENSNTLKVSVGILLVGLVVLIISKNKKGKENE